MPLLIPKSKLGKRLYEFLQKVAEQYPNKFISREILHGKCAGQGFSFESINTAFGELDNTVDIARVIEERKVLYRHVPFEHQDKLSLYRGIKQFNEMDCCQLRCEGGALDPSVCQTLHPELAKPVEVVEAVIEVPTVTIAPPPEETPVPIAPTVQKILDTNKEIKIKRKKWNLYEKQYGLCYWCKNPFGIKDLTYDHVIPKAKGGTDHKDNLVLACVPCNSEKGHLMPDEWVLKKNGKL